MQAAEILDRLESSRERLLMTLESLPDEALVQPGVMGDWSIADILSHLVAWEAELITGLMRIDQGKEPTRMLAAFADVDGYNARRFEENRDRDLNRIFDDLRGVRLQLEQWMDVFDDRDLNDPDRYTWAQGASLGHIIEENSFGHEAEHLPEIEAYAKSWQADHRTAAESEAN